ncbi:hypothetical protein [Trichococcus collinsii]|uniref:SMODS-associating 2TM beta-strand rich effector domain-containing protein n=1 Tax=Trichococcus collinsii TaxID=157076 RepID=A0AB37ZXT3_9LACT|nr:hypothetical protein [Trichococcus collinsii]CZR03702.1 Hypothetical protein Tcol_2190 [Trichococcus collinsii]SEA01054.1 hypothetical protein SAMN04488525_101859 [Trichococcus collinsii]
MTKIKVASLITATVGMIIAISLIFTDTEKFPLWLTLAVPIFGIVTSYVQFIYNNWDVAFILWHKILAWFQGETVSWTGSCKFLTNTDFDFRVMVKEFTSDLKNSFKGSKITKLVIHENNASFGFDYLGYERNIDLFLDIRTDYKQLRLKYSSTSSYNDSKKEHVNFLSFIEIFSKKFVFYPNPNTKRTNPLYSVEIIFSKFNPFYRLTIKHLGKPESIKFELKFQEEDAQIHIYNKKLEIHTEGKDTLAKILKDYIALSSIEFKLKPTV